MAEPPQLTPEIERALARYVEIQEEEKLLAEEKARLQDLLKAHMAPAGTITWQPALGGLQVKVRYRVDTEVRYDEALLKDRLGDRYSAILAPDMKRLRVHLAEAEPLLAPILQLVGTPVPSKVQAAIEAGVVRLDEFRGAFEKTTKRTVTVMRVGERGGKEP